MRRRLFVVFAALATAFTMLPAGAAEEAPRSLSDAPEGIESLKLAQPIRLNTNLKVEHGLWGVEGPVFVSVRLSEPSAIDGSKGKTAAIERQQARFLAKAAGAGAKSLGSVKRVLNAVFLEVDASQIQDLAADADVMSIKRVRDYELDLSDTVPYIGATTVQDLGYDGTGVTVAVLDSGVDYTHAALGGPGTALAYENAYGTKTKHQKNKKINDAYKGKKLFPTEKVVGGYDFVGEEWPFGPLSPDPDPIDFEGHGTHVADIIGGVNGVAPGVEILAVKVCSAVSSACSGIALLQGMDFAVDNGADIINMSLGALYGQAFDDDLAAAVEGATAAGVLTVAASGNSSDKPYVTSTPAAAPSALSVAQTHVPSAIDIPMEITAPADAVGLYEAVFQPWSKPQTAAISGLVTYGDGAGGNLDGCAPFAAGSLSGIVAVDRGGCFFSTKIQNIEAGGGELGIIMLIAPGAPFPGGFGEGDLPQIPGYMISQADGDILRGGDAVASFDPANGTPLIGTMVGSSSRGPSMQFNLVKPEIGAPGASISAEAGTGTGVTPFGGTSGATPMVAGSAALLLQAEPSLIPAEVKARLINTGETEIYTMPGGTLTSPITRIGGGEVRVDRAVGSDAAAWDSDALQGALSFGFVDVTNVTEASKTVLVRNYGSTAITFDIIPTFRDPADAASGAVAPSAPAQITVPAGGSNTFVLDVTIDGAFLDAWYGNSGFRGANPSWLNDLEFDGYLLLDAPGTANDIHLPWHVLPRKASDLDVAGSTISNTGVGNGNVEGYNLYAVSGNIPEGGEGAQAPVIDFHYVGVQTFGFAGCDAGFVVTFAVNTWERQTHANAPALFEFDLDLDQDGTPEFAVFNADISVFGPSFDLSDGRNVTVVQDLSTNVADAVFFTDHETNSANTVLIVCGEQIGLTIDDLLDPIDVAGFAVDVYFTGNVTDTVDFTWAPLERFVPFIDGAPFFGTVAPGGTASLTIADFGSSDGALGVLLMDRGGAPIGREAFGILIP